MASYTPIPLAYNTFDPVEGSPSKPPIIFAHGVTSTKENWNTIPQVMANKTGRKVYAIDARNHGDSEWCDVFNFDCNVDDLLHFMDTLDIRKAVLVGHSMGGITSIKIALKEPERVEKLIVEDMNVQKLPQETQKMSLVFFKLARTALGSVPPGVDIETAQRTLLDSIQLNLPEEMKKYMKPKALQENIPLLLKSAGDGRYAYRANLDVLEKALGNASELFSEYTGLYKGPALFVYGQLSPFQVGSDEPSIKKLIPNAELVCMEGASHSVHSECQEKFLETILKFILKE